MAVNRTSKAKGKILDLPANAPTIGTADNGTTGTDASIAFTAPSTATGGPIITLLYLILVLLLVLVQAVQLLYQD